MNNQELFDTALDFLRALKKGESGAELVKKLREHSFTDKQREIIEHLEKGVWCVDGCTEKSGKATADKFDLRYSDLTLSVSVAGRRLL